MSEVIRKRVAVGGVAIAAPVLAAAIRYVCFTYLDIRTPLLILHAAAVALVAQYCGTAAGLVSTAVSFGFIVLQLSPIPDSVTLIVFLVLGVGLSVSGGKRQRTEDEIRRIRYNLETAQALARTGSWESDLAGTIWWSPETYSLFGVAPGTRLQRDDFFALVHPDDRERVRVAVEQAVSSRGDYDVEHRIIRKNDGAVRYVHQRAKVTVSGTPHLVGSIQDITESHETLRALRRAHERLELRNEVARIGTFEWTVREDLVEWSPEMERLYGIQSETHRHTMLEWQAMVHPDDLPGTLAAMAAAVRDQLAILDSTYRIIRPDGQVVWIESRGKYEYDAAGNPVRMLGVNMDVSELKFAEQAVSESNAQLGASYDELKAVFDVSPTPLYVTDADHNLVYRNRAHQETFKDLPLEPYSVEEHRELVATRYQMFTADGEPVALENFPSRRVLRGEAVSNERYLIESTLSGERRECLVSAIPIRDPDGRVRRGVVGVHDITAIAKAERELRMAYDRLALSYEAARIGSFEWFVSAGKIVWSPEMEQLYGISSPDHVHSFEEWQALVHPDDLPGAMAELNRALELKATACDQTYRIIRTDGQVRWIHTRRKYQYDAGGNPLYVLGINMDVTELKRTEEALERAGRTMRVALEAADAGGWSWNLQTGELIWTDNYFRILGIDPNVTPSRELFYSLVHPDDLWRVKQTIDDAIQGRTREIRSEFRIPGPDGVRWFERRGRVFVNSEGQPAELVGITSDITERKTLRGLLPTCAQCKRIRDEHGNWQVLERYINEHSDARLSHGFCPECLNHWLEAEGLQEK